VLGFGGALVLALLQLGVPCRRGLGRCWGSGPATLPTCRHWFATDLSEDGYDIQTLRGLGGCCREATMEIPTETHQNEAAMKVFNFAQTGQVLNWYLA
jgi:hypothetical protein